MKEALFVYPHQLFSDHPGLDLCENIVLIEEPLFFTQFKFHKKKLIFHRASMKYYERFLSKKGKQVFYLEADSLPGTASVFDLFPELESVVVAELDDDWLSSRLQKAAGEKNIQIRELASPGFLLPLQWSKDFFAQRKKYFFSNFYQAVRKKLDILQQAGKPEGGKWSFDTENRSKLPGDFNVPEVPGASSTSFVKEAVAYVENNFSDNYGCSKDFPYPITEEDSKQWLDTFLIERLEYFGTYQDAISQKTPFLYHSVISPMLNVGLLTPEKVVQRILEFAAEESIPMNSLEGFIRQIIGWREYIRVLYHLEGRKQRTKNYFQYNKSIPESFWNGTTGITPLDDVIKKTLKTGYAHHIERLMVAGNFMLLAGFNPDSVYEWFMTLYIDAYDWVMVPNVYGMSQYADGGLMITKPYVSSSNYIRKMSNYKKGDWSEVWDSLYWSFLDVHQEKLSENRRMQFMFNHLKKMNFDRLSDHKTAAKNFMLNV